MYKYKHLFEYFKTLYRVFTDQVGHNFSAQRNFPGLVVHS